MGSQGATQLEHHETSRQKAMPSACVELFSQNQAWEGFDTQSFGRDTLNPYVSSKHIMAQAPQFDEEMEILNRDGFWQ